MKTALIVDDSALARAVLRRTLRESGIFVDEAPSAEVAIEYLRSERPDVIFLDHLMPGMNGFEALRAIKANPDTAVIPVIMYTSQEGQLYMSQARALGAVDVLPKTLQAANVKQLLRAHHLTNDPDTSSDLQKAVNDVKQAARGIVETACSGHEEQMLALFRSELQKHRKTFLAELRVEFLRMANEQTVTLPPVARPSPSNDFTAFGKRSAVTTIAVMSLAAFCFGIGTLVSIRLPDDSPQKSQRSITPTLTESQHNKNASPAPPGKSSHTDGTDLTERSMALVRHYAFGAIPLDDERAREYEALLADLRNEGFAGTLKLEVFEGRFCLNLTSDGSYELAPLDQLAMTCDRIGAPSETVSNTQQSLVFSNMLAVAGRGGQLRIETAFYGAELPIVDYPALDYEVTAGEWNAAAAYNQRVALRLPRDIFDTPTRVISEVANGGELDPIVAELGR